MSLNPYNLLRRTFLVAAAAATIAALPNIAFAGNVTKSDGTALCTSFDSISLGPNGLVINNCSASTTPTPTPTPPPPATGGAAGTFTIAALSSSALAWNTGPVAAFTITRSGGTTGPVTVNFYRDGGCGPIPLQDSVGFADGQTSANVTVKTPNNDATCTFTLNGIAAGAGSTATSPPVLGSVVMAYVLVGAGAGIPTGATNPPPPPPPPVPGTGAFNCPATPADANANFPILYGGNSFNYLKSGQIGYSTLPLMSSWGAAPQSESANIAVAISTASPPSGTVEVSINHCPGVIDATGAYTQGVTGGKCYISFAMDQSVHNLPWFEHVGNGGAAATDAMANSYGVCEAYTTNGPWYVNVRYNYTAAGVYDMALQWSWGYFNP